MQPTDFWIFAGVLCCYCHEPVDTRRDVPVIDGETLVGMRHRECGQ